MASTRRPRSRPPPDPRLGRPAAGLLGHLAAVVKGGVDRLRPRSIRGRMALLATVMAVLLLAPAGLIAAILARQALTKAIWLEAREQAVLTAASVRDGRWADPVVPRVAGIDLIQ
ncbi:hypothetical protein, partial [Actinomadura sp. HBU206391]|uniref:hypothetical protein n=1 Tax=Actinomadura sp. HBU206391 TaxID=2731692 RepID=UPI0016501597